MTTPLDIGPHTNGLFATPLVAYTWPDSDALNSALRQTILEREAANPAQNRSSVGGWQSDLDLFTWPLPEVATLRERVLQIASPLTKRLASPVEHNRRFNWHLDGWANICRRGHYHGVHNHPNSLWSGAYYVATGTPDPDGPGANGQLELLDPRPAAGVVRPGSSGGAQRCLITPKAGLMVVFPSWLQHLVHPFQGDGERISISFNFAVSQAKAD